jgi:phosphoenolpyruvate synthase/pyruvate phosphate dikinase
MFVPSKDLISYRVPLEKMSIKEVGGKGWNLFCLLHFGFPVPPWCVVSSSVFDKVLGIQRASIRNILTSIDFTDPNALDHASLRMRDLIIHLKSTEQFSEELFQTLNDIFGKESLLSVRSSVIGEDSAEDSFAGQMDSFLNVRPPEVLETIKEVWASAFSSRALVYRQRKNLSLSDISTAVIIQQMVQSSASGVLFTREPRSREKHCLISAGFGLGEGVVANKIKTDTYRINWDSNEISKDIPVKDYRIVLNTTTQRENRVESVPTPMQSQQVLADMQIQQLRDVGIEVEECFGKPQDIEWAYDAHGRLFILQARPIVFTKHREPHDIRIWDNSNIVESYPGLTLPLTFTFIRNGYESSLRNAALGFLISKNTIAKDLHIFKNMVGLLDGRVYYNLLNWYQMLSYLPGFKKYKVSWDQMIGIKEQIDFHQSGMSRFNSFLTLVIMFWRLLTAKRNAKKFFAHFYSVYNDFRDIDVSASAEDDVIHLYESLAMKLRDKWHMTLYNDFCAIKYYDWLKQLCRKWDIDKYTGLHNHLLCGEAGIESVAPVRSLILLAEIFRTKTLYRELINEDNKHVILQKIQNDPAYTELKTAIEAHLESFGDRGPEELKLEKPSFREEPALLIRLIKNYYQMGLSIETIEKREQDIRRNAKRVVHQHLKNPLKRLVFEFVLRNARLAIANREDMRFARTRLYGIVRRLFRRMADIFIEKGLIESASDFYYLTVEEVFAFVQGTSVTKNLKALVETRKGEYAEFMKRIPKERIHTIGIPYLNPSYETETGNGKGKTLKGIGCSSGIVEGTARVIFDPHSAVGSGNHILVTKSADPGWVFLMISSKGMVVEKGSVLSHTAIIGRELGIPTIVGVKDATKVIPDGAKISMNGSTGEIRWQ